MKTFIARLLLLTTVSLWLTVPAKAENPLLPGVLGQDDREPQETDGWPWIAIGRVNLAPQAGHCTGTLIAPDRVLTAAHCLYYGARRRWYLPSEVHFLAGYNRGSYRAHRRAAALYIADGISPDSIEHRRLGPDLGIIELKRAITDIEPLRIPEDAVSEKVEVMRAGYSKDRAHLLSVDRVCTLHPLSGREPLLAHDCDATLGDSGSPLLEETGSAYSLVAISVAVTTGKDGARHGVGVSADIANTALHALPDNPGN